MLRHIYNAECPLMMSAEAARAHITRKSKRVVHVSTRKKMKSFWKTRSRLSRKDRLPFKERNLGYNVINLVM